MKISYDDYEFEDFKGVLDYLAWAECSGIYHEGQIEERLKELCEFYNENFDECYVYVNAKGLDILLSTNIKPAIINKDK